MAESCAVGAVDVIKGHVPLIFVTLKQASGAPNSAATAQSEIGKIEKEITESVRSHVGAIATPRHVMVVQRLPKTRSGKILRGVLRSMVAGDPYRINSAEDPTVIAELRQLLKDRHGIDTRPPQT